ncbi:MAG: Crp/Fnr family transcriptional regulator [Acidobacteria bacterium]|nr:MAG: Crp/Fnr family transcriptional regulator [Acidobacteriota bacterium]
MKSSWYVRQINMPGCLGDDEDLRAISDITPKREYQAGEIIYYGGDHADALYIIKRGQVTLSAFSLEGKEKILEILHEGDIFGEMFLDEEERGHRQAKAVTKVTLCIMTRRAFLELCRRKPQAVMDFMSVFMKRLRDLQKEVEDFAFTTARERFIKLLGKLCAEYETTKERDPHTCVVRFSQDELAHLLGLTRERVNALVQEFKRKGLVQSHYGYVTVNRDQLREFLGRFQY